MSISVKKAGAGGARPHGGRVSQGGGSSRSGGISPVSESSGVSGVQNAFSSVFDKATRDITVEDIKKMVETLDGYAKRLSVNPTFRDYEEYRDLVRDILGEICSKLYKFEYRKEEKTLEHGRVSVKKFAILKKLDMIEENLAIVEDEFKRKVDTDLIAKFDQIKGLLLDLVS